METKVVNTKTLLELARWADKTEQNRRVDTLKLSKDVDRYGMHLLHRILVFHNDEPVDRVYVFAKIMGKKEPANFTLDVPHELYESLTDLADVMDGIAK